MRLLGGGSRFFLYKRAGDSVIQHSSDRNFNGNFALVEDKLKFRKMEQIIKYMQYYIAMHDEAVQRFAFLNSLRIMEASSGKLLKFGVAELFSATEKNRGDQLKKLFSVLPGAEKKKVWMQFELHRRLPLADLICEGMMQNNCTDPEMLEILEAYKERRKFLNKLINK